MTNFSDILNRDIGSSDKPKPLPAGVWTFMTSGLPAEKTVRGNRILEFQCKPLAPKEGVDEDALDEFGDIGKRTIRLGFFLNEDSIWRLEKFMTHLGFDEGINLSRAVSESQNRQFLGEVKHTPSADGTDMYANITNTAAVD